MAQKFFEEVAMAMGLCPEKGLPMANEENKKLLAEIDGMGEEKNNLQTCLQNYSERADRLVTHAKNSELTHAQNMKLIFAFQSDLRAEQSMSKVAEREISKLSHDLKELEQELENLCKYDTTAESEINKKNTNISDLSNRINWIKAALIEWRECMEEGNAANELIEKYCKDDNKRYMEIETKRRLIQNSINNRRKELIDLVEEQKSLEQNLDRTANLYRAGHAERRDMVDTWKSAVNRMNQRENDILKTESDLEACMERSRQKEAELKDEENRLDAMIANNREVEEEIQLLNNEISDLREHLQYLVDTISLRENEVDILRKELYGLAQRVQVQRHQNRLDTQRKVDREKEVAATQAGNAQLKQSYENLKNKNMNAQERLHILEEMIDSEERTKDKLTMETNRMNELLFRTQQHLWKLKDDEKVIEVENRGLILNITALENAIKDSKKFLLKQTDNQYEMALKAVMLQRRIAKLKGTMVDPQEERLKLIELAKLEAHCDELNKTLAILQSQTKKLEADMRNLTICYDRDMKQIEAMNYKMKEAQLYCEGGVKKIRSMNRENQERIVELSLLRMRVNQMESQIDKCQDKSYNLEKHRLQMIKTVKERTVEINSQYDVMYVKRKHLNEELCTLKCDIGERNIKIAAAKSRYELTAKVLGTNEDGSMVTATQMKIENAQEKQMLLEEGNILNENVLRAEREIKAMEHTLNLMNCSNDMYRRNFEELDKNEDLLELKNLQSEYCEQLEQLKILRNKIITQERQIEQLYHEKEAMNEHMEELIKKKMEDDEALGKIHKELIDQTVKLERATREVKAALKVARQRDFDAIFLKTFNKELDLKELEQRNTQALQLVADLIENDLELAPHATNMLYAKGIECPKTRKLRGVSSWRREFSDLSFSSSKEMFSARTSEDSEPSVTKLSASTRPSVVSLDFPTETFIVKREARKSVRKSRKSKI